jgi:hypothetical protein
MRALLVRLADRVVPEENPAAVVYGVLVVGALLAAESGQHESYLDTVASAAVATALYWFAHAYAELLGHRLATPERLSAGALVRALGHDWVIACGAAVPLGVLAIAWAAGAAQQTAVTAAVWSTATSLVALELIAGVRAHDSPRELALQVGAGTAMGIAILALKIILH